MFKAHNVLTGKRVKIWKKIKKKIFGTKKSEIFQATRCCFSFFDTMRNSYFLNKIRYIFWADGRIVSKILAGDLVWFRLQVMVSRGFSNTGDPRDRTYRWNPDGEPIPFDDSEKLKLIVDEIEGKNFLMFL